MEKWTFNGIDLTNKAWGIQSIDGLGTPGLRGSNIQIPFMNGNRWIKKRYDSKVIMIIMYVLGVDKTTGTIPQGTTYMEQLDINIDYLLKLFGIRGQHSLKRTMRNGEIREAQAEIYKLTDPKVNKAGDVRITVEFELVDPFFYSTDLTSQLKTISSTEYTWTHNNPGTAPVTAAVITLKGPLDSPRLENLNNNIWLKYQGAIATGETVIINTKDFTCEKDGENYISAIKHGGDAYWLTLEPGNNNLELTTQETGGSIEVEYYPAYF